MSHRRTLTLALTLFVAMSFTGSVHSETYYVDPVIAKNMRIVDVAISRSGGSIQLPASDGVSGRLDYPSNNACPRAAIHIAALGPAGVERYNVDTVFVRGWKPFYLLTVTLNGGACSADRIMFNGFPQLEIRDPVAAKSAIYYMDLGVEMGNETHIPVGPPDERDSHDVLFSFSTLPHWAHADSTGVAVPTVPTYRIIIGRQ